MTTSLFEEDARPDPDEGRWQGYGCVYGPAQPQGSKKAFIIPRLNRPVIVDANEKLLKPWRQSMIVSMRETRPPKPFDEPVQVFIWVYVIRPAAHFGSGRNTGVLKPNAPKYPGVGKDLDKIMRACLDSATGAGWWINDSRVADATIHRRYILDEDDGERTVVTARILV